MVSTLRYNYASVSLFLAHLFTSLLVALNCLNYFCLGNFY
uniref:Uncharacterized protein n=1 Tax=Arundo donax TaxID=35708 RepID=A0A0A8YZM7_ARUDO